MKDSKKESLKEKITYYWKNPENGRYYNATLTQDLLGDWVIIKAWGGDKSGRVQHFYCASYAQGLEELKKIDKRRKLRGYINF